MTIPGGAEVSASQSDAVSSLWTLTVGDDDGGQEAAGLEAGGHHDAQEEAEGQHQD